MLPKVKDGREWKRRKQTGQFRTAKTEKSKPRLMYGLMRRPPSPPGGIYSGRKRDLGNSGGHTAENYTNSSSSVSHDKENDRKVESNPYHDLLSPSLSLLKRKGGGAPRWPRKSDRKVYWRNSTGREREF